MEVEAFASHDYSTTTTTTTTRYASHAAFGISSQIGSFGHPRSPAHVQSEVQDPTRLLHHQRLRWWWWCWRRIYHTRNRFRRVPCHWETSSDSPANQTCFRGLGILSGRIIFPLDLPSSWQCNYHYITMRNCILKGAMSCHLVTFRFKSWDTVIYYADLDAVLVNWCKAVMYRGRNKEPFWNLGVFLDWRAWPWAMPLRLGPKIQKDPKRDSFSNMMNILNFRNLTKQIATIQDVLSWEVCRIT